MEVIDRRQHVRCQRHPGTGRRARRGEHALGDVVPRVVALDGAHLSLALRHALSYHQRLDQVAAGLDAVQRHPGPGAPSP
jgi:hypothetical protein